MKNILSPYIRLEYDEYKWRFYCFGLCIKWRTKAQRTRFKQLKMQHYCNESIRTMESCYTQRISILHICEYVKVLKARYNAPLYLLSDIDAFYDSSLAHTLGGGAERLIAKQPYMHKILKIL